MAMLKEPNREASNIGQSVEMELENGPEIGASMAIETVTHGDRYTRDGTFDWKAFSHFHSSGYSTRKLSAMAVLSHGFAALAFVGVEVNLVLFSTRVLRQTNAEAATTFTRWMGSVHLFSLVGAFLSDSYWGMYKTCLVFQSILLLGLALLSSSSYFFLLQPSGCGKVEFFCQPHSSMELVVFYISLYLIALGNGGYEPSLATLGSNQFEESDSKEKPSRESFYGFYYVATNLGSLFSETILAYLEDSGKWVLSFWVSASSSFLAASFFLSGTFKYRYMRPCGNPLPRFCQVIVAALKKINFRLPQNGLGLYEVHGMETPNNGVRKILHTEDFKFLDRAAVITSGDEAISDASNIEPRNPWRLCTVTQVEEVKCVLRLLPIWFCIICYATVFMLILALFLEQGASMNNRIGSFRMPPASMTVFDILSTAFFIIFNQTLLAPLYAKITKRKPIELTEMQRMAIGLVFNILSLLSAGLVETQRLRYVTKDGKQSSSLNLFWQVPQYVLVGFSEALVYVGQMDFFGKQTPEALKSLGIALSMSSISIGSFFSDLLIKVTMDITTKGGRQGWIPPNLNHGHLNWFFFMLAGISAADLLMLIWCARRFKAIVVEERSPETAQGNT
ncbi:protein NRT1/ PTR FAMILY 7.2-like [Aristolochia californica]|uniref:protein NRT1/ PTR FAMILY 7.2-like n=1 Tax=Aristolochia californica TaxID=171875 RepID=UPI0035DEB870